MSGYIPSHFAGDDATGRELIARFPFATLVTAATDGPRITHLPLLLDDAGTSLIGHVARPNPHWQAFEQGRTVAAGGTDEIATVQWMERNGGQTTISREPRRR